MLFRSPILRLRTLSTKTLRIQTCSLFFCCIVLSAAMISSMLFFATREAVLRAFVGTLELRRRWLRRFRLLVGVRLCIARLTTVCLFAPSLSFPLPLLTFELTVKLVAIFPWFSLFFTFIAAVVLLKADKVTRAAAISSRFMRRSMFDDRFGCRLSGFMLAIDWQGCRAGVDAFFYFILGGCCAMNEDEVPVL